MLIQMPDSEKMECGNVNGLAISQRMSLRSLLNGNRLHVGNREVVGDSYT